MRNAESASSKGCARFQGLPASGPAARSTRSRTFPLISRIVPASRRSRRAARKLPKCFWTKCKSLSFRAKLSAHPAICGFPTPRPSSASKKVCGASSVFSPALKPLSDCGVRQPRLPLFRTAFDTCEPKTFFEAHAHTHRAHLQPEDLGSAVVGASLSRKIKSERADRRSVAHGCGLQDCIRAICGQETWRSLERDAGRMARRATCRRHGLPTAGQIHLPYGQAFDSSSSRRCLCLDA